MSNTFNGMLHLRVFFGFIIQLTVLLPRPCSQTAALHLKISPVFHQNPFQLEQVLVLDGGDSLVFQTLRFYLGNFRFARNGSEVFASKKSPQLIDLAEPASLQLELLAPESFDRIIFDLGIDSLTQVSGVMGGDLDPVKGMYWTWQSGYIQAKLEGYFNQCNTRDHTFQFHLGGYLPPFRSLQTISLPLSGTDMARINLDLGPWIEQVNWQHQARIMSPSAESIRLSQQLSKSFSIHAQ